MEFCLIVLPRCKAFHNYVVGMEIQNSRTSIVQHKADNFAVVKVQGNSDDCFQLYVVKITSFFDNDYHGHFYKRVPNSYRNCETTDDVFTNTDDVQLLLHKMIQNSSARY